MNLYPKDSFLNYLLNSVIDSAKPSDVRSVLSKPALKILGPVDQNESGFIATEYIMEKNWFGPKKIIGLVSHYEETICRISIATNYSSDDFEYTEKVIKANSENFLEHYTISNYAPRGFYFFSADSAPHEFSPVVSLGKNVQRPGDRWIMFWNNAFYKTMLSSPNIY